MIGVFDSGLGGLSVLAAIAQALPRADLTYLADTAHVPYGSKTESFIRERVLTLGDQLINQGCKLIVVACNTATVTAIAELRRRHPGIPVVGVEPAVKPAAQASRSGKIAILATELTSRSPRLQTLIDTHAAQVKVRVQACPGWATRVETLDLADPTFIREVAETVLPLLDWGADQIVLGCTHYSFLTPLLAPLVQGKAQLVDVPEPVARQVVRLAGQAAAGQHRRRLQATARPERLHAALHPLGLDWLTV